MRSMPADGVPGETLTFDAFVYQHLEPTAPIYAWGWCPVVGPSIDGYPCVISHEKLQAMVPDVTVPEYGLGEQPTATLTFDAGLHAAMTALCTAIDAGQAPGISSAVVPSCKGRLEINILMTVQWPHRTERAIKSVPLLLMENPVRNTHPTPGNTDLLVLRAGVPEKIQLEVHESDVEAYDEQLIGESEPQHRYEDLTLTWFVTGGSTLRERTSFIRDVSDLATFASNIWTTPNMEDASDLSQQLIVVLRDNRGGITWWTKQVNLHE